MKDLTCYIIDYLPSSVTVRCTKNRSAEYELRIILKGSRGITLMYVLCQGWHGTKEASRNTRQTYNRRHFGVNMEDCIYFAEYIRSDEELASVAQNCHAFLKKHGLINGRVHNVRGRHKLFSATSNH